MMVTEKDKRIVETPTEGRQAEPGPSNLVILIVSVALAVAIVGGIWLIYFR